MNVSDFDYNLPEELIAQRPTDRRDACRLLVIHRSTGKLEHRHFSDILEYLKPGDCLVFNDSRVIPARLFGTRRGTGAKVEFLLSKKISENTWETLVKPGRRCKTGDIIDFDEGLFAEIKGYSDDGTRIAEFSCSGSFEETLERIGSMPLPPYINRKSDDSDKENYQNVYARTNGSVACATAGLHWTPELIRAAQEKGVKTVMMVGIMTNFCIDATIRTGFDNGFEVLVPEYTNSTSDNEFMDRATCYRYYNEFMWPGRYAKCITMEEARNRIKS